MTDLIQSPPRLSIYDQLVLLSSNFLAHYNEDLTVHDRKTLATRVKANETWLWQVRPTGTWLARWDVDTTGRGKDSFVECLIKSGLAGNWEQARWYLFHVQYVEDDQPYGFVSKAIPVAKLAEALPRPQPKPVLPGQKQILEAVG